MYSEWTVLVLGGTPDDAGSIARMLADQYRVIETDSPADAFDRLSLGVNVVVVEIESAKSSVLELLRSSSTREPKTPCLAVVKGGDVHAAVEAMKLGAADCLVKPLSKETLQAAVSRLIEAREHTDSERKPEDGPTIDIPPGTSLGELERAAVTQALAQHQGNRTHAAKTLGISVRTLQRKLKAWGIPIVASQNSSTTTKRLIFRAHAGGGGSSAYGSHAH